MTILSVMYAWYVSQLIQQGHLMTVPTQLVVYVQI